MDHGAAAAYVNAKANGMLRKSFIGSRAAKLFSVRSLDELWTLLYKSDVPDLPEVMLASCIEQEAEKRFVREYIGLLQNYSRPDEVFKVLLYGFEYENLKRLGAALATGRKTMPYIIDIAPYNLIQYKKWPDISAMTEGSVFEWYNTAPKIEQQKDFDHRLDVQYVRSLWSSAKKLSFIERKDVLDFIRDEYVMENILWALRLKVYHGMKADQIIPLLAFIDESSGENDVLAGEAVSILDKDICSWDAWADWKYASMLNPHEEGAVWSLDPRYIERKAKKIMNDTLVRRLHLHPLAAIVLVSYFKIKQNEVAAIRTATESLRLNADKTEVMSFIGVSASQ